MIRVGRWYGHRMINHINSSRIYGVRVHSLDTLVYAPCKEENKAAASMARAWL